MALSKIDQLKSNDKLVFNTIVIYINSIVTIFVMLYVTRVVVKYLGPNDFGLNNVISGVVSMLTFISASMSVSTQRYISHALGANDKVAIKSIYSNSFVIHLILAVLLVIVFEVIGLYFINYQLNIQSDRYFAAHCLLQFTILSTFFTITATPNDAAINARENMSFLAVLGIFEVALKLLVAVLLQFFDGDRLILYGFLLMVISILLRVIKWCYVRKNYKEFVVDRNYLERSKMKELYHFAGWNLFGALSVVGKNQGFAIAINMFFGTLVNAAFAISNQVSGQLLFFSRNLLKSMNPQIVKFEGAGDRERMINLSYGACKFGFILTAFMAIPFIFEIDRILGLWLTEVPEYTALFCQYMIISLLIGQLTIGLQTGVQAAGQIKMYQFLVGSIQLLNVPVYFLLFYNGFKPFYAVMAYCFFEFIACVVRLQIFNKITSSSMWKYIREVTLPQIIPTLVSIIICTISVMFIDHQLRFLVTFLLSIPLFFVVTYKLSLSHNEKAYLSALLERFAGKLKYKLK